MLLPQPMPPPEGALTACAFFPFLPGWSGRDCADCDPFSSKVCAQPDLARNKKQKTANLTRLFFTRTTVVGSLPAGTLRPLSAVSTMQQRRGSRKQQLCCYVESRCCFWARGFLSSKTAIHDREGRNRDATKQTPSPLLESNFSGSRAAARHCASRYCFFRSRRFP